MSVKEQLEISPSLDVSQLKAVYEKSHRQDGFFSELTELISDNDLQSQATWLLKAYLEKNPLSNTTLSGKILPLLPDLTSWEAQLNLLQCLPYLAIEDSNRKVVEIFLRKVLNSANKFVRAWAYNGFHVLATQHPEYQAEVKQFFEMALRDEAPSVKARIRNITKKGF